MNVPTIERIPAHENNYQKGRRYYGVPKKVEGFIEHRTGGAINGAIATFQNGLLGDPAWQARTGDRGGIRSANVIISETRIVEMVDDGDTAFGCGNWIENVTKLQVEHEGYNGKGFSDALYNNSAYWHALKIRKHKLNLHAPGLFKKHGEVKNTACPVDLDVDRIKRETAVWIVQMENAEAAGVPVQPPVQVVQSPAPVLQQTIYAVAPGDSMNRIAAKFGTTLEGLLQLNPHKRANPGLIRVGEQLTVRSGLTAQAAPQPNPSAGRKVPAGLAPGLSEHAGVKILQDRLKELGWMAKNIDSTGNYGPITADAVLRFQKSAGIMPKEAYYKAPKDNAPFGAGYCGEKTAGALNR